MFWKINLEIKTLVKKSQVLGQNVTGNKVLSFRLFLKIIWGLPIKSQEIRLQELKSLKK